MTAITKLQVEAPADLKKGFPLEVEADGKRVVASCPCDVQPGDMFEVDLRDDNATDLEAGEVPKRGASSAGKHGDGDFKYGLCGCTDSPVFCSALWWFSWIFTCIPTAQLLSRLRLNAIGSSRKSPNPVPTFVIVVALYTFLRFIIYFFPRISYGGLVFFSLAFTAFTVYWIVLLTRTRMQFRGRYRVAGSAGIDCLVSTFCSCCSIIQMHRQTQDESELPYDCCTVTGFPSTADVAGLPDSIPGNEIRNAAVAAPSPSATDIAAATNGVRIERIDL
jgi:Cys-rich protein (TIGR01571 family)